jgi:hypothetical protein
MFEGGSSSILSKGILVMGILGNAFECVSAMGEIIQPAAVRKP